MLKSIVVAVKEKEIPFSISREDSSIEVSEKDDGKLLVRVVRNDGAIVTLAVFSKDAWDYWRSNDYEKPKSK